MACIALSGAVSVTALAVCSAVIRRETERVYVICGEDIAIGHRTGAERNRMAEAAGHVRKFHELFFTLVPDPSAIESSVRRALCLADNSAFDHYMDLRERGYYDRIVSGGVVQRIEVDSVVCRMDSYPYEADTYARQFIIRQHSVTERRLHTSCRMEDTVRSEDNPHGFIIGHFTVTDNRDIRSFQR